ncbi:hypothetical protein ECEH2086_04193 [Escherichia coli O145:H28]|nr:hypothetical protein ECEH2086_04193 [Escherichia coli O145:H28]
MTVERDGDLRARRQPRTAAADGQRLAFFIGVQDVIAADGVKGNGRQPGIDRHLMGGAATVSSGISDAGVNGHRAVRQCRDDACRNADAPVAAGIQHRGESICADSHRHGATGCHTRGGSADDLCLCVFRRVDHIIACHRVDGDDRNRSIHRQVVINRGRVSGFVAHRRVHGVVAGGQGAYVGLRHTDAPATVRLYGASIVFAIESDGHRLPCFRRAAASDGQRRSGFGGVKNVVARNGVNGHRWRAGIDAVSVGRGGAVAVNIADAGLCAGIAITQGRHICRRNRGAPGTIRSHRGAVSFAAKGDGDRLSGFDARGAAGEC